MVCAPGPGAAASLAAAPDGAAPPFLFAHFASPLAPGPLPLRGSASARRARPPPPGAAPRLYRSACVRPYGLRGTRSAPQSCGPPSVRLRASGCRPCSLRASRCSAWPRRGLPAPFLIFGFLWWRRPPAPGPERALRPAFFRPWPRGLFVLARRAGLRCSPGQLVLLYLLLCCRWLLPCLPPVPAAPAGGLREARGCAAGGCGPRPSGPPRGMPRPAPLRAGPWRVPSRHGKQPHSHQLLACPPL